MDPEKIKLAEEPVAEHKNAIPTNYKTHLDKQQHNAAGDIVPPGETNAATAGTNPQRDNVPVTDAATK